MMGTTMVGWMNRAVAWCWWSSWRLNSASYRLHSPLAAASSRRRRQQQLSGRVGVPPPSLVPNSRMDKSNKKKFYAVAKGRKVGIFDTWKECSSQVNGFKMACFQSFPTRQEAVSFIERNSVVEAPASTSAHRSLPPRDSRASSDAPASPRHHRPNSSVGKRPLVALLGDSHDGGPSTDSQPSDLEAQPIAKRTPAPSRIVNPYKKGPNKAPSRTMDVDRRKNSLFGRGSAGSGTSTTSLPPGTAAVAQTESVPRSPRRTLTIHINFDGGSRGNPGLAGAGASVTLSSNEPLRSVSAEKSGQGEGNDDGGDSEGGADQRRTIHIRHYLTRKATNNEAEYDGLVTALRVAKQQAQLVIMGNSNSKSSSHCDVKLIVQGDSDLIIKQLRGSYQCRHPNLVPLYRQAIRLIQDIRTIVSSHGGGGKCEVVYEHVYRDFNAVADGLANQAMDAQRSWMTSSDEGNHSVEMKLQLD